MDAFPNNSHAAQAPQKKVEEPVKEIKRVVTGTVVRRKKSLGSRFKELVIGGDTKSVGQYILMDVVLPAVRDMVADSVSQGVERMIFGEARSTSRRTGARPSGTNGYVSYNRFATGNRPQAAPMSRRARATHDFDEIIVPTRVEAERVVDDMAEAIDKYSSATVADLYEMVGEPTNFTDQKWGWTDFRGAGITRVSNGYLLDLPKPELLD